ncbi:O-antigen ligase family protein [Schumannella soli]|uniref:O-antigen ligase-related domain-containing protein n=1 Tax=Schumannella soli TaxID=2590779 RepID=A0A506Y7S2_9MICO|nr:O-antigen ligase family protein [Schumannella soli]TPW76409.1 hypothetical protein FJ657_11600 [Schumannella soli]
MPSAEYIAPRRVGAALLELPRWPFAAVFLGYPLWWLLGVGDLIFVAAAVVMALHLARRGRLEVPRGFGLWLLFLAWMLASVIGIDSGGRLVGFVYRAALYLAATVLLLYVYNARAGLDRRYVSGVLTVFWVVVVAGGWLGVLFPLLSITTPMAWIIPDALRSNEVVQEMVVRRVTQWDPTSVLQLDPRPSAPFLYTNVWGNVYSMLLPVVIAYLVTVRRTRRFWLVLALIPLSFVPAFLTLNRGMFIGLGVAAAYIALRAALRRQWKVLGGLAALAVVVGIVFAALPVSERLTERLDTSSTTEDRANLYQETFERSLASPVFGYGAPRPSETDGAPSAGTQGQIWNVLFSHGFPAAALFLAWLVFLAWRTRHARGAVGVAGHAILVVLAVEVLYYGVLVTGLAIGFLVAALLLRPEHAAPTAVAGHRTAVVRGIPELRNPRFRSLRRARGIPRGVAP